MKRLLIPIILLLSLLMLVACGGENSTETVIFADGVKPSIIYSRSLSTEADRTVYNDLAIKLRDLLPGGFLYNTDETERFCTEIVIGKTTRPVSVAAEKYLNENTPADPDIAAYVIYVADDSVAIIANGDLGIELAAAYFAENYLTSESLVLPSDFI